MINTILIVNPFKRPRLEEIKATPFYKKGMKLLEKDNTTHDPNIINEQVYLHMNLMGYSKEDVIKNVEQKKFNNIRTTYELLYNKIRLLKPTLDDADKLDTKRNLTQRDNDDKKYHININVTNKIDNLNINFKDSGSNFNNQIIDFKSKIPSKHLTFKC